MNTKPILIASDHGGFRLKEEIIKFLKQKNYAVSDLGAYTEDSTDYPAFAEKVAEKISNKEADRGILICGTGIGMSIVANKFPGVRAALVHDEFTTKMSKNHNNANILVFGGRSVNPLIVTKLVEIWLTEEFEGGRHQSRLDQISKIEKTLYK